MNIYLNWTFLLFLLSSATLSPTAQASIQFTVCVYGQFEIDSGLYSGFNRCGSTAEINTPGNNRWMQGADCSAVIWQKDTTTISLIDLTTALKISDSDKRLPYEPFDVNIYKSQLSIDIDYPECNASIAEQASIPPLNINECPVNLRDTEQLNLIQSSTIKLQELDISLNGHSISDPPELIKDSFLHSYHYMNPDNIQLNIDDWRYSFSGLWYNFKTHGNLSIASDNNGPLHFNNSQLSYGLIHCIGSVKINTVKAPGSLNHFAINNKNMAGSGLRTKNTSSTIKI